MSDIIRELAAGRPFTCPTSERAITWACSIQYFTFGQLVDAITQVHGTSAHELVAWAPDARIESLFGRFPLLRTPAAEAAGFRHDGDLPTLVRRALETA
jgi:hypothetical protein